MHVAFVTYKDEPNLTEDDQVLAQYLSKKNITVCPAAWDDAEINWQEYDVIVLRSMWDYFEKQDEFNTWLDEIELHGGFVLNPVSVVRWNQNKNYFLDLSARGILLPPYQYLFQKANYLLADILKDNNWNKAVVKPAVSCGSFNTWIVNSSLTSLDELRFARMLEKGDVIVQKFMHEIIDEGELSLIFFNKQFSHAISKKPKEGDFRVQLKFGGTAEPIVPDKKIIQQAAELLNSINESLLYARVDGVIAADDKFYLMELELIEPRLSVSGDVSACEKFYEAFLQLLHVKKQV
jgi:glutathione synthase/RimK-type ligase-like ATP-grasp enzyme